MTATPRRADARRSRALLLEAGAAAFAERGLDVPVAEITRRAGLAKGTFFRHFPTKRALLVAILAEHLERHRALAAALIADPVEDTIAAYMTGSALQMAPIRAVIESAILSGVEDPRLQGAMGELIRCLDLLVGRAQERGELRADVTGLDVHVLVLSATGHPTAPFFRDHPELWRRYLAIVLDGLRPTAARPLPVPAVDPARLRPAG